MQPKLDWSKLPANLAYLAAPAEKYGHYQFDDNIYGYLANAPVEDKLELMALSERLRRDGEDIYAWHDQYLMTQHPESRLVYFMGHLIGLGLDAGLLP